MKKEALGIISGSGDGGRNLGVRKEAGKTHLCSASFMLVSAKAPSPTYLRTAEDRKCRNGPDTGISAARQARAHRHLQGQEPQRRSPPGGHVLKLSRGKRPHEGRQRRGQPNTTSHSRLRVWLPHELPLGGREPEPAGGGSESHSRLCQQKAGPCVGILTPAPLGGKDSGPVEQQRRRKTRQDSEVGKTLPPGANREFHTLKNRTQPILKTAVGRNVDSDNLRTRVRRCRANHRHRGHRTTSRLEAGNGGRTTIIPTKAWNSEKAGQMIPSKTQNLEIRTYFSWQQIQTDSFTKCRSEFFQKAEQRLRLTKDHALQGCGQGHLAID